MLRLALFYVLLGCCSAAGAITILKERDNVLEGNETSGVFVFNTIPSNSNSDLGQSAEFKIVKGILHVSSSMSRANDGFTQRAPDLPGETVFSDDANVYYLCDLGGVRTVGQVNTYSWHEIGYVYGPRSPQNFTLYASDGRNPNIDLSNPQSPGWVVVGSVNTTDLGFAGQHGVSFQDTSGVIGRFRYLLWDVRKPSVDANVPYGDGTFYGEFDIVAGPEPNFAPVLEEAVEIAVEKGMVVETLITALDENYPEQELTFSFAQTPPSGAELSPSGQLSWDTKDANPGLYEIKIQVTDNGTPPMSDTGILPIRVLRGFEVSITKKAAGFELSWPASPGTSYRVEHKEKLTDANWTDRQNVIADSETAIWLDQTAQGNSRFYRVVK